MRLLIDEMYPQAVAGAVRAAGFEARTASESGLNGRSDDELFAVAISTGCTLLTENVADFARIAGDHTAAGLHHPGVLIALSSRFARGRSGVAPLAAAVVAVLAGGELTDRVVYLERAADG